MSLNQFTCFDHTEVLHQIVTCSLGKRVFKVQGQKSTEDYKILLNWIKQKWGFEPWDPNTHSEIKLQRELIPGIPHLTSLGFHYKSKNQTTKDRSSYWTKCYLFAARRSDTGSTSVGWNTSPSGPEITSFIIVTYHYKNGPIWIEGWLQVLIGKCYSPCPIY